MFATQQTRSTDLTIPTLALVFTLGFVTSLLASVAPQPAPAVAGYHWIDGDGVARVLDLGDDDAAVSLVERADPGQL